MRGSRQVRLRLALPWLAESFATGESDVAAPLRAPSAEWLVARSRTPGTRPAGWRAWLLEGTGAPADLLERFPAGPCTRAAQVASAPRGTWACARPVHLLTAIEHLQFGSTGVVLGERERAALCRDLNAHFADRGYAFHAHGDGLDWAVQCPPLVSCSSPEPAGLVGRNLRDLLPSGPDGATITVLMNEIQMLLHEHPVNAERATRGLPIVNALWLWGFGSASAVAPVALARLATDDAWLAGLWHLHGAAALESVDLARLLPDTRHGGLLGWSRPPEGDARERLAQAERWCFQPARSALTGRRVEAIDLLLGDHTHTVDRSARWRFWRRSRPLAETCA